MCPIACGIALLALTAGVTASGTADDEAAGAAGSGAGAGGGVRRRAGAAGGRSVADGATVICSACAGKLPLCAADLARSADGVIAGGDGAGGGAALGGAAIGGVCTAARGAIAAGGRSVADGATVICSACAANVPLGAGVRVRAIAGVLGGDGSDVDVGVGGGAIAGDDLRDAIGALCAGRGTTGTFAIGGSDAAFARGPFAGVGTVGFASS